MRGHRPIAHGTAVIPRHGCDDHDDLRRSQDEDDDDDENGEEEEQEKEGMRIRSHPPERGLSSGSAP